MKKRNLVKFFGICVVLLSVGLMVLIFIFSSDIRGTKKAVDRYFTAIQNENYDGYVESLSKSLRSEFTLLDTEKSLKDAFMKEEVAPLKEKYGDNIHLSFKIQEREINEDTSQLSLKVKISGDEKRATTDVTVKLSKDSNKWYLMESNLL